MAEISDDDTNNKTKHCNSNNSSENPESKQLVVVSHPPNRVIGLKAIGIKIKYSDHRDYYKNKDDSNDYSEDDDDDDDDKETKSLIDYSWSKKILEMVGNKAKLVESFSWLSTVGGGFSALGEKDSKFSMRAGCLSLGQQLRLAELLGDERLKVMCHLFAALAALQLDNKRFCVNYLRRIVVPLLHALPYRDPILMNMLRHICFRLGAPNRDCIVVNAIKYKDDYAKK